MNLDLKTLARMASNLRNAQKEFENAKVTCFDKAMDPELFNGTVELSNIKEDLERQFDFNINLILIEETEVANA